MQSGRSRSYVSEVRNTHVLCTTKTSFIVVVRAASASNGRKAGDTCMRACMLPHTAQSKLEEPRGRADCPAQMLALSCVVASTFLPSSSVVNVAPAARVRMPTVAMQLRRESGVESAKVAAIAAFTGSVSTAPVKASAFIAGKGMTSQFIFANYALAFQLAVFGVVYRWAVRSDNDDGLRQGMVAAFAACLAVSSTHVKVAFSPEMWLELAGNFGLGVLGFGFAAYAIEYAYYEGWARRMPGTGAILPPPPYYDGQPRPFSSPGTPEPFYIDDRPRPDMLPPPRPDMLPPAYRDERMLPSGYRDEPPPPPFY